MSAVIMRLKEEYASKSRALEFVPQVFEVSLKGSSKWRGQTWYDEFGNKHVTKFPFCVGVRIDNGSKAHWDWPRTYLISTTLEGTGEVWYHVPDGCSSTREEAFFEGPFTLRKGIRYCRSLMRLGFGVDDNED